MSPAASESICIASESNASDPETNPPMSSAKKMTPVTVEAMAKALNGVLTKLWSWLWPEE